MARVLRVRGAGRAIFSSSVLRQNARLRAAAASPQSRRLSSTLIPHDDIETVDLAYSIVQHDTRIDPKDSPILFLHGLFGSKANYRTVSKNLSRDLSLRPIYLLDLRNHGDSPHHKRHDYLAMAEDVAAFIAKHGITDPTIIGHSMGAKAAMTLALCRPDIVKNIVAVDNAPVHAIVERNFTGYMTAMFKIEEAGVNDLVGAQRILKPYEKSLPIRNFLLANLDRPKDSPHRKFRIPLKFLRESLHRIGEFPFKDPSVVRFDKPALFIRGTQSKYLTDEALRITGQFFPQFELAEIDSGHWLITEKPTDFRQAVTRFLAAANVREKAAGGDSDGENIDP